jgi:hypothetical protein
VPTLLPLLPQSNRDRGANAGGTQITPATAQGWFRLKGYRSN